MRGRTLYRLIAVLMVGVAIVLLLGHPAAGTSLPLSGIQLWLAGAAAGFAIGAIAAIMGVAGGELLIPTLVLLYGLDIKLTCSLSLSISLP